MLVISIGKGAERLILNQVEAMGSKTIVIEPGKDPESLSDMYDALYGDSLKEDDIEAIKKPANVRGLAKISPVVVSSTLVSYQNENIRGQVVGGDDFYLDILGVDDLDEGVMFGDTEIKQNARVVVIGSEIKDDFFGFGEAVGKKIKIKNQTFRIVGALKKSGTMFGQNIDKMVLVPYSTAQKYILGINYYHAFMVEAENEEIVPVTTQDIKLTLREQHEITDPSKDDFRVANMDDAIERVGMMTTALTVLLVSVSAISLLVGGIGIMNIMLVSVTERTHEIGLRKSLGATSRDILYQFLFESIFLTGIGGMVGIALGSGVAFLMAWGLTNYGGMTWDYVFPVTGALLGIGMATVVGLIFGIYPARQAAKKSPIEALRYE